MKLFKLMISGLMAAAFLSAAIDVSGQRKPKKPRKAVPSSILKAISGTDDVLGTPMGDPSEEKPVSANVKAFLEAWSIVNSSYFDATFGGLDWERVKAEYLPRAEAANTEAEIDDLILEMVGKLGKSHFGVIPASFYRSLSVARKVSAEREGYSGDRSGVFRTEGKGTGLPIEFELSEEDDPKPGRFGIGIELRSMGGKYVIVSVLPGSSAALAGVKPGYILDEISGIPLNVLSETITQAAPNVRHLDRMLPTAIKMWLLDRDYALNVKIVCLDEHDQRKEFDLPRQPLNGEMVSLGGLMPQVLLEYSVADLNGDVGYVKFNVFSLQVLSKFCDSITAFSKKKALVVDLRGNMGGLLQSARGLSGMMEPREAPFGISVFRGESSVIPTDNKVKKFNGRVVILVDDQSMSAAELLSAALQDNARAVVVGQNTAGEALPSMAVKLANGSVMQYPIADFLRPNGTSVEAVGVQPDVVVPIDRIGLLTGKDQVIEKALQLSMSDEYRARIADREAARKKQTEALAKESVDPPPPKDPKAKAVFGSGTMGDALVKVMPKRVEPLTKDKRALALIDRAAKLVGGISQMQTYSLDGTMLIQSRDTSQKLKYSFFREAPDKYAFVSVSDLSGTTRAGAIGKETFFESSVGLPDRKVAAGDDPYIDIFEPIKLVLSPDFFKSLKFDGTFDDDGKKLSIIEGRTKDDRTYFVSFDMATGLPFRISDGVLFSVFDDYRREGAFLLPRRVKSGGIVEILISSIRIGEKIDRSVFVKHESCFDRP